MGFKAKAFTYIPGAAPAEQLNYSPLCAFQVSARHTALRTVIITHQQLLALRPTRPQAAPPHTPAISQPTGT